MRTATWAIALALTGATSVQAQERKVTQVTITGKHGCMTMSDSTAQVLGLSADQAREVKESDARCMKACEKTGTGQPGWMDQNAMITHDGEMQKILNAEQYAKWAALCNTSKAANPSGHMRKY